MAAGPSPTLKCSTTRCLLLSLALLLAALLTSCGGPPGRVLVSDQAGALDQAQLEAAAAPLVARGAVVAVITVARGGADPAADVGRQLDEVGLLEGGATAPAVIALYVSLAPRYSELRAGARWSKALPDATLREIRQGSLNPALRDGRFTAGVADTLRALEAQVGSAALGEWLKTALSFAFWGLLLSGLIWLLPIGERIGRLWRLSPPGKLLCWLWDQTPSGQARLQRILRTTQLRLDDRVEYARSWCLPLSSTRAQPGGATLGERLAGLDHERAQALQTLQGRALVDELDRLAWAYQALGGDADRLTPKPPPKKGRAGKAGASYQAPASTWEPASSQSDSSYSDTSTSWDSGGSSDSSGPSSDGGSW